MTSICLTYYSKKRPAIPYFPKGALSYLPLSEAMVRTFEAKQAGPLEGRAACAKKLIKAYSCLECLKSQA